MPLPDLQSCCAVSVLRTRFVETVGEKFQLPAKCQGSNQKQARILLHGNDTDYLYR
jgi:hypothetical protein